MIFQTVFILKKDLFLKKYLVLSSLNNKNVKILSHLPKAAISSLSYSLQRKDSWIFLLNSTQYNFVVCAFLYVIMFVRFVFEFACMSVSCKRE